MTLPIQRHGRHAVAFPVPTFSMIPTFARMNELRPIGVPLRGDWDADADALLATGAKIIYLCSPNNPTGTLTSEATIRRVVLLAQQQHGGRQQRGPGRGCVGRRRCGRRWRAGIGRRRVRAACGNHQSGQDGSGAQPREQWRKGHAQTGPSETVRRTNTNMGNAAC